MQLAFPTCPSKSCLPLFWVNICKTLCDYKWQADKVGITCSPDFTLERFKIQIHAVLELVLQRIDLSPASLEQLDWDVKKWKMPTDNSALKSILPQVSGLSIHKSSALPYKRLTQAQLSKMGETALDRSLPSVWRSKERSLVRP